MEEERDRRPTIWKALRGRGTAALVEQFTQEMTLLAEGLCEDQARLRRVMEELTASMREDAQELHRLQGRLQAQEERIIALENRAKRSAKHLFGGDRLGNAMLLAAILCGMVLAITVLKIFI